jgi:hypothetical protein
VLAEWMAANPESKAQLQKVGWEVMAGGMQTELNRRLIAQVTPEANAAIDGLRHTIDQESLSKAFSASFHLFYIDSGTEQRWNHLNGKGRYTSRDIFDAADLHPVEQQIESLRLKANVVLRNEGSLQDLYSAIDKAIPAFGKKVRHESLGCRGRSVRFRGQGQGLRVHCEAGKHRYLCSVRRPKLGALFC